MKHNTHTIRRIRYRDLSDYLSLCNNCFYDNPADAPVVQHLMAEKIFYIFNKLCRYFLPIFSQRYSIYGYYKDNRLISLLNISQSHRLWPYIIQGKTKKKYTRLVAVQHSHRRKGIGKKLSSYVANYYKDYDIFSELAVDNKASLKMHTSSGYQPYDRTIEYTLHMPKMEHQYKKTKKPFSISNKKKQINHLYELYKASLSTETLRIEKPLIDYFKIPPLYRINVFLFNLLRIYSEGRYVRLRDNQSQVKVFVHVRNYMMTRQSEMLMIASEKLSDSDLNWVKGIIDSLANIGQKEIITYIRKHQTNIQDALKALNFIQKEERLCLFRKAQQ